MINVYESCPKFESDGYLLRLVERNDASDLVEVYGDKNALPFFNSDNCHGDNFYYPTKEKMEQAIDFWMQSYQAKWFVRWVIFDKQISKAVGTIEMFHRSAEDAFDDTGVLRIDVRSDYERTEVLQEILKIFMPSAYELFDCAEIITKVPIYAVERLDAVQKYGFSKSDHLLVGTNDHYAYNGYWIIKKQ
jgi:RimJ/RimL family protein N-acetyltransferase